MNIHEPFCNWHSRSLLEDIFIKGSYVRFVRLTLPLLDLYAPQSGFHSGMHHSSSAKVLKVLSRSVCCHRFTWKWNATSKHQATLPQCGFLWLWSLALPPLFLYVFICFFKCFYCCLNCWRPITGAWNAPQTSLRGAGDVRFFGRRISTP